MNFEEVIAGAAEIVRGAVAKVVEYKILNSNFLQSGFPGTLKFVERLAVLGSIL